jgi:hypothetical protein
MHYAVIYVFVVVAGAPLIGIWRGHVWAKANGHGSADDGHVRAEPDRIDRRIEIVKRGGRCRWAGRFSSPPS